MTFDALTMLVAVAIVCATLSTTMLLAWRLLLPRKSLLVWGLALASYASGEILLTFRDTLPHYLTINLAHMLLMGCYALTWWGMALYRRVRTPVTLILGLMVLFQVLLSYYIYVDPDIAMRTLIIRVFTILYLSGIIRTLLRGENRKVTRVELVATSAFAIDICLRAFAFGYQFFHIADKSPLFTNKSATVSAFCTIIGIPLWGVAVILLVLAEVVRDLRHEVEERRQAEELLRSEQAYRQAIEMATAVGVAAVDMEGRQIYVNPSFCRMVGWSEDELLDQMPPHIYWAQEKSDEIGAALRNALAGAGSTGGGELPFRRASGEEFLVQVFLQPIHDRNGVQIGVTGAMVDISERKRMEDDLFTSRELLRTVIDTIPLRLLWKDRESHYLGANQAQATAFGFGSPSDLVGSSDDEMPWHLLAPRYRTDEWEVMENGVPKLGYVEPLLLPGGCQRWLRSSKAPLHDRQGQVIGILSCTEDITDQKRTEDNLIASERRYRLLFTRMLDGFALFTVMPHPVTGKRDFRLTELNAAFARLMESPAGLLTGNFLSELDFCPEEEWRPRFEGIAEHGETTTFEIRSENRGLMLHVSIYRPEEGQVAAIFEDITDEHLLRHELERLARVDGLTGLWTRRFFFERAEDEFCRLRRFHRPVALLLFDLDHFKQVNDTWGHLVGDQVLAAVGSAIRRNLRQVDLAGRYGGEELVLLLPETDCSAAYLVAERLREAVASLRIPTGDSVLKITTSCGATCLPGNDDLTLEKAIARADLALYQAKSLGRNRTVLLADGEIPGGMKVNHG